MIRKTIETGSIVGTLAGTGEASFGNGTALLAKFAGLQGIFLDGSGDLYIADRFNNRIRKMTAAGVVSTVAGSGKAGFVDGPAQLAEFKQPIAVTKDGAGNIFVAEQGNQAIRKIGTDGNVITLAGNGTAGFADGTGAAARFRNPISVAVDGAGNLYVADALNHRIRKVTPAGAVTTLAGNGTASFADGPGTSAMFNAPAGIVIDAAGNLCVTDENNARIRKVTPAGVVSTLAGSIAGHQDGSILQARFNKPGAITIDASGDLYLIDRGNLKTRRITAAGVVSTVTGQSVTSFQGYRDGFGATALFNNPSGIAINGEGTLLISDMSNNHIRWITL